MLENIRDWFFDLFKSAFAKYRETRPSFVTRDKMTVIGQYH